MDVLSLLDDILNLVIKLLRDILRSGLGLVQVVSDCLAKIVRGLALAFEAVRDNVLFL